MMDGVTADHMVNALGAGLAGVGLPGGRVDLLKRPGGPTRLAF